MDTVLHENKTFQGINYSGKALLNREFYKCRFEQCDFSKADFSGIDFTDCSFTDCNFTMTVLKGAGLKNTRFTGCKLMGIDFSACNDFLFTPGFTSCILDYSTFHAKKMRKVVFAGCSMRETDFTQTDLSSAIFKNCDLAGAVFSQSILEKADFRTASNYIIDPELNRLRNAHFDPSGLAGLLTKYKLDIDYGDE